LAVREHREAARPIVAGLGGRIVKTMGDGLLLCFGGESETIRSPLRTTVRPAAALPI
jgi:class 3 adenylate cyclase